MSERPDRFASLRRLRELLPELSDIQYAGFSALALERSNDVFDFHFAGSGPRGLRARLLDGLWGIAEGRPMLSEALEAVRGECESLVERLYEQDDTDYPLDCVKAMSSALCRWAPREWDEPAQVAVSCQDIVASCGLGEAERFVIEEGAWQVATAEALSTKALGRPQALRAPAGWVPAFAELHRGTRVEGPADGK